MIKETAAGQHAERRIEVIEARICQRERDARQAEMLLDEARRRGIRAKATAHPEQLTAGIEDAVTGAFEHDALGQRNHLIDQPASLERAECSGKHRLLALPLRVMKARKQRLAVKNNGGVCREHEVG